MSLSSSRPMFIALLTFLLWLPHAAVAGPNPGTESDPRPAVAEVIQLAAQVEAKANALAQTAHASQASANGDPSAALAAVLAHTERMAKLQARENQGVGKKTILPIISVLAFFTAVFLLAYLPIRLRNQRHQLEIDLRSKAIAAGVAAIPELPDARPRRNDRRSGVLLAGLGVAVIVASAVSRHWNLAAAGVAPLLLGVAYYLAGVFCATDEDA